MNITRRRIAWLALGAVALAALAVQLDRTQLWQDREVHAGWRLQEHVLTGRCRLRDAEGEIRASGRPDDCARAFEQARRELALRPESGHLVLMLHGMGRSPALFGRMEKALRRAGYDAVAISYPSLTRDVAGHVAQLEELLAGLEGVERVSFVTHSLGGIVVRQALARDGAWRDRLEVGRVVMLAPPNQGSALAAGLADWALFHAVAGPSGGELAAGGFAPWPEAVDLAVIAGGTAAGRGLNPLLAGNDDGIVTVEETRLDGAADHLVVPAVHTVIASHPEVIAATLSFLAFGRLR